MSGEKEQKAGTTGSDEARDDAQDALAGGAETADRDAATETDAEGGRTDWKARYLTEGKPALERANRLEQELKDLRERMRDAEKPPTADPREQQDQRELLELQQEYAMAKAQADAGDGTAKLTMRNTRLVIEMKQERIAERAAARQQSIDDEYAATAVTPGEDGEDRPLSPKERRELREFYQKNRATFGSLEAAHDAWMGRQFRSGRQQFIRDKRESEAELRRRSTEDVVRTHHRDVSAGQVRERKLSEQAFADEYAKLMAEGKEGEAFDLMRKRMKGEVKVP